MMRHHIYPGTSERKDSDVLTNFIVKILDLVKPERRTQTGAMSCEVSLMLGIPRAQTPDVNRLAMYF